MAVVGPTAAGKSALALEIAGRLGLGILCCDSVQIYRELEIGSAKPSPAERAQVPHSMVDMVDPDQVFSAGQYGEQARAQLGSHGRGIFCGGTGLYLRAAAWSHSGSGSGSGSGDSPRNADRGDVDPSPRAAFEAFWMSREGGEAGAVHAELRERDPETAAGIHPHNVVRALRALWLCEHHQEPISVVRKRDPPQPLIELLMIVVDPGVAALDHAIDDRCEAMLTRGWLAEVEKLCAAGYDERHKAMRSLGYRELLDHLNGRSSLEQATEAIKRATRKYARRQRTYFRHQFRDLLSAEQIVHIDHPDACPKARVDAFLAPEKQRP